MKLELQAELLARRFAMRFPAPYAHFDPAVFRVLIRAERTLHRWAEEECNGTIQRTGDDGEGSPVRYTEGRYLDPHDPRQYRAIPDRERSTLAKVQSLCTARGWHFYHQTDPRGCSLYVDVTPLDDQNYHRGFAVCL